MSKRKQPDRRLLLPVVLSGEEIVRFLQAVPGLRNRAALTTAYGAGLRVCEVAALKVGYIDSSRMVIRVEHQQVTPRAPWEIRRIDLDAEPIRGITDRLHRTGKLILQGGCAEDQLALFIENAREPTCVTSLSVRPVTFLSVIYIIKTHSVPYAKIETGAWDNGKRGPPIAKTSKTWSTAR